MLWWLEILQFGATYGRVLVASVTTLIALMAWVGQPLLRRLFTRARLARLARPLLRWLAARRARRRQR